MSRFVDSILCHGRSASPRGRRDRSASRGGGRSPRARSPVSVYPHWLSFFFGSFFILRCSCVAIPLRCGWALVVGCAPNAKERGKDA